MARSICRTLIAFSLNNTAILHKPPISNSISVLLFSSSTPKKSKPAIPVVDYLTKQHQFSLEAASEAALFIPYINNPEKSDSILSFLKENGFSKSHIDEILKKGPYVLCSKLNETIKPKLKILQDLGFSQNEIADILAANPWIFTRSLDCRLAPSISVLRSVLGPSADVCKALKVSAWYLKYDLEKTMIPNIEFLQSCGVSSQQIIGSVYTFPRLLLHKPENLRDFVKRVDEMGVSRKSKMYFYAVRTLSSMNREKWENKLKLFRNLGFSGDQVLSLFRRAPHAFAVSETKIKEVCEMFLARKNLDASFIFEHPELLIHSVKGRLEPRFAVFEILERKNLLRRKPKLTTLLKISQQQFMARYVLPYSNELGDVSMLLRT
ncbi:hypothetical protein SLEP1_g51270 [Rubroshorea leprosula]|uniref:Uncharacterized protein n=1 Tax=Rubroshorea leprosula TaxID=152421 RepID=A0AAV5M3G5_9ROSI|nr:hypothetical protein SLEP1_g51270 [Rubroshorea leprosula]